MNKRYASSNKFNIYLLILFFIIATVLSFLVTAIAAIIGLWLLPPYTGMIMAVASAVAIYWIQIGAIRLSKNRNIKAARTTILISSILSAFFHLAAVTSVTIIMGENIRNINIGVSLMSFKDIFIGAIALFRWPIAVFRSFFTIGVPWIIYFLVSVLSICIIPLFAAEQALKPFSEEHNSWMQKIYSIARLELVPDRDQPTLVTALAVGDLTPFLRIPKYSSQISDSYSVLTFYKVGNVHTGYVGMENFHQSYDNKNRALEGKYQVIDFIPPTQMTPELSEKLEKTINISTSVIETASKKDEEKLQADSFVMQDHGYRVQEDGYKLYRTMPPEEKYKSDEESITSDDNIHAEENPQDSELSKSFKHYLEESIEKTK